MHERIVLLQVTLFEGNLNLISACRRSQAAGPVSAQQSLPAVETRFPEAGEVGLRATMSVQPPITSPAQPPVTDAQMPGLVRPQEHDAVRKRVGRALCAPPADGARRTAALLRHLHRPTTGIPESRELLTECVLWFFLMPRRAIPQPVVQSSWRISTRANGRPCKAVQMTLASLRLLKSQPLVRRLTSMALTLPTRRRNEPQKLEQYPAPLTRMPSHSRRDPLWVLS